MNRIVNTEKEMQEGPESILTEMILGGPNMIENQEKRGQNQLVESEVLPTEIDDKGKRCLEDSGVVFLDKVGGDEIFTNVTLPSGW